MQNDPYLQLANLITLAGFVAAFILTLWPGRTRSMIAAILYIAGVLTCGWSFVSYARLMGRMGAGTSSISSFIGIILPVWTLGYTIGAGALLWPAISQSKALRCGKLWHLAIGIPLIAVQMIPGKSINLRSIDAGWLLYALLWFRVRESYAGYFIQSRPSALEPPNEEQPDSTPGSVPSKTKWLLYSGAWVAIVLVTLLTNPRYIAAAASFPIGLLAVFPNGEQKAIEAWMLGPASVGSGWTIYAALTFIIGCTKKAKIFSTVFTLFCLLLALNVVGCQKTIEAASKIH